MKKEQARGRYVGPNSQRLLERLKHRGFKQVFDFLDTDKDGYVDLKTANFDRLNQDVIEDLKRVMKMKESNGKMEYDMFADLMLQTEKIEKWRKQGLQQEMAECTFRPYLISVSRIGKDELIACGKRGVGQTITDVFEKVQQEVQGFHFQKERGGPELLGVPTPGTPDSPKSARGGKRDHMQGPDKVSELDDLPKTKNGLFFGLVGGLIATNAGSTLAVLIPGILQRSFTVNYVDCPLVLTRFEFS